MATGKLIATLQDLQEAAKLATAVGACTIQLHSGETLVLTLPQSDANQASIYDVTDPDEEEIVLACLEPGGEVYQADAARGEMIRRLKAAGIQVPTNGQPVR